MTVLARSVHPADMFQRDYDRHASEFERTSLDWLNRRRRAALDAFAVHGIPTRRFETWKYTDISSFLDDGLQPIDHAPAVHASRAGLFRSPNELFFAGGFLTGRTGGDGIEVADLAALDASTPDWIKESLGIRASGEDQPMGALSLALMRGGAAIRIHRDTSLHLSFWNPAADRPIASHSRVLIVVEPGVSLRLLESHAGGAAAAGLRNLGIEFVLNPNSHAEHIRVQRDARDAIHVTSVGGQLRRDAHYRGLYAALGARLSRVDINLALTGENAEATLNNIAVLDGGIADITSVMDHASPRSRSRQLFKSVVGGSGRAVNQGRVLVREGAVKSDSHQLFRALLLSPRAEADAKPELEILADDVLCGHGTAIGALDSDALFYLQSRGIPERESKLMLIRAFVAEAFNGFDDETVIAALWRELEPELDLAGAPSP